MSQQGYHNLVKGACHNHVRGVCVTTGMIEGCVSEPLCHKVQREYHVRGVSVETIMSGQCM